MVIHKKEQKVIIYDTCGLIITYWRTGSFYLPKSLYNEGIHVVTAGVIDELSNLNSGNGSVKISTYPLLNKIYSAWACGELTIDDKSKIDQKLKDRLPQILRNNSPKKNQRVGVGEESIIASLTKRFKKNEVIIVTQDSDVANLLEGLNLTERVKTINPEIRINSRNTNKT